MENTILQVDDLIIWADPVFNYCVSWVILPVTKDEVDYFLTSWNHHRVPGQSICKPIENMKAIRRTAVIVIRYQQNGSHLNREVNLGEIFWEHVQIYKNQEQFYLVSMHYIPPPKVTFSIVAHGINRFLLESISIDNYFSI